MADDVSRYLARNIRAAREGHGLSQQQMANLSGVPRPTWANLESGEANPTVSVLTRVAAALQVSLERLLAPPESLGVLVRKKELVAIKSGKAGVRQLVPDAVRSARFERIELKTGGQLDAEPHSPGTREYLACESGVISLAISGESWTLQTGDVLWFPADQRHTYRAAGPEGVTAYSLVILP